MAGGGGAGAAGTNGVAGAAGGSGGRAGSGGTTGVAGTTGGAGASGSTGSAGSSGSTINTQGISCTPETWSAAPIGFATVSGGTTGGGNATPVVVTSSSQFNSAAGGSNAAVIHVSGRISGTVTVGSNKTIWGLCNAEVDGSIDMTGSSNVIMRNLKVVGYNCTDSTSDCSAGHDAVHVQGGNRHLWFDHMDISNGSDGNLDITHGSDFITISWTKFHYSGRRTDPAGASGGHEFSNLIGHSDTNGSEDTGHLNVTFDHTWWADFVFERQPRVRFGKVHIFNSLYTASGNSYCVGLGVSANIRVENSVFQGVKTPFDVTSFSNSASVLQSIGNTFSGTSGNTTGVGPSAFAPPYSYSLESVSAVAADVMQNAGPK
jgi:pectate lyase